MKEKYHDFIEFANISKLFCLVKWTNRMECYIPGLLVERQRSGTHSIQSANNLTHNLSYIQTNSGIPSPVHKITKVFPLRASKLTKIL